MIEIVPLLSKAGYHNIDLNFCEMMNPEHDVNQDYISILKAYKSEFNIEYTQCHVPYAYDYSRLTNADREFNDNLIKQAFTYSGELEVDTVVIHPIKASVEANISYFERMIPYLPQGCRLAIENMDGTDEISTAADLNQIVKVFDGRVGICLDTGHAHMRGLDLPDQIRQMGSRLIATHIADNRGKADEHAMPFFGSIPWEDVMQAMKDIDYKGNFTYEIMYFFRYIPEDQQMDMVSYSLKVGDRLEELFRKAD